MTFYLEIRNKIVYARNTDTDYLNPRLMSSYWKTTLPNYPEFEGLQLRDYASGVKCVHCFNKEIPVYFDGEYPEFTEFYPISKPNKKGKWIWKDGNWKKY